MSLRGDRGASIVPSETIGWIMWLGLAIAVGISIYLIVSKFA